MIVGSTNIAQYNNVKVISQSQWNDITQCNKMQHKIIYFSTVQQQTITEYNTMRQYSIHRDPIQWNYATQDSAKIQCNNTMQLYNAII